MSSSFPLRKTSKTYFDHNFSRSRAPGLRFGTFSRLFELHMFNYSNLLKPCKKTRLSMLPKNSAAPRQNKGLHRIPYRTSLQKRRNKKRRYFIVCTFLRFFDLFRDSFTRILFIAAPAHREKSQNSRSCSYSRERIDRSFTCFT